MNRETRIPAAFSSAINGLEALSCGRSDVQPALGGHFLAPFGHQAGRVRPMAQGDLAHLVGGGHLEVQRQATFAGQGRERLDILVGDVPAVLLQVGGDAARAGGQRPGSAARAGSG